MWQPIETAPKDGADVLVYCANGRTSVACWNAWLNYWIWAAWREDDLIRSLACAPSHWQPIPEPPKDPRTESKREGVEL